MTGTDTKNAERTRYRVVSLDVDRCTLAGAVERAARLASAGRGAYICFATVHMIMESYDDADFARVVNDADMIVPDGMPNVWMQKAQGAAEPHRIRANDLMIALCEYAAANGLKVGFFGGKPEVIEAIVARAKRDLPSLDIACANSPPFRELTSEEDAEIVNELRASGTQILFIGLGCPKQERWMAAHKDAVPAVMLGVGASFDFYAGKISESPAWLGRLGLEWLYRLFQEPSRLWRRYLILNPRFMVLAAAQLVAKRRGNT